MGSGILCASPTLVGTMPVYVTWYTSSVTGNPVPVADVLPSPTRIFTSCPDVIGAAETTVDHNARIAPSTPTVKRNKNAKCVFVFISSLVDVR